MYWRRRAVALGVLAAVAAAVVLGVRALGGSGVAPGQPAAATQPPPAPQLPRGGRTILPRYRVVAYYGNPRDRQLGALGIGTPAQAGRRLLRRARAYRHLGRPVLPAMELIAVVAANAPGPDGAYRTRAPDRVIRRYLRAARRIRALLILDIQPGRSDFFRETVRLERWLRQPDVSLALDPEWRVDAPQVPGQVIGSVGAQEVNAVSFWLSRLVREHDLPQKLLLVHRFTEGMLRDPQAIRTRPGLALTVNVDGFGGRAVKRAKYEELAAAPPAGAAHGFKLFFEEDTDLMTPRAVGRLRPRPDVVVYE